MVAAPDKSMRNVGTGNHPVSWLHQRTVALLYDELTREHGLLPIGDQDDELRVRLTPCGDFSHNLREGVASVHIPGEWDNVGGVVPDLICRDGEGNPVRIIEVIVTNPPDALKGQKLDNLKNRGVDVVEVTVETENDLRKLCWMPVKPTFRSVDIRTLRPTSATQRAMLNQEPRSNERVIELIRDLTMCAPDVRRQFLDVCSQLGSLDSLYPIRPDNPLKERLTLTDEKK